MILNIVGSYASILGLVLSVISIVLVSKVYLKINKIDNSKSSSQIIKGNNNNQKNRQK
jgi:uncharacterized membrane protein